MPESLKILAQTEKLKLWVNNIVIKLLLSNVHFKHALTVYSAQGTIINGNTFTYYKGGMDRANIYVAASRHKDESHVFCNRKEIDERLGSYDTGRATDDKERQYCLASMMSRENREKLAIELLSENHIMDLSEVIDDLEILI